MAMKAMKKKKEKAAKAAPPKLKVMKAAKQKGMTFWCRCMEDAFGECELCKREMERAEEWEEEVEEEEEEKGRRIPKIL